MINCHNQCTHAHGIDADGFVSCAAIGQWVKVDSVSQCRDYQRHVERVVPLVAVDPDYLRRIAKENETYNDRRKQTKKTKSKASGGAG